MSTKLIVTDGDASNFEKWLTARLATIRQPDWDDDTLKDLNEYIRTLVKRQPSDEEFLTECEDVLDGVPMASAFVHGLLQAIRSKRYRSATTGAPLQHHDGLLEAQEVNEGRPRPRRKERRRKDRSRSPPRRGSAVQPAQHLDQQSPAPFEAMLALFFGNLSSHPLLQNSGLPSNQGSTGTDLDFLKQYQCVNFRDFGICLLGPNCHYAHNNDALPPLLVGAASQTLNPAASSWVPETQTVNQGRPKTCSILITNIPAKNLTEDDIKEHFQRFGSIHSVAVDEDESIAVVTYADNQSATRAFQSPDTIFASRFVETRYFRGSVVGGQIIDNNNRDGRRGIPLTLEQATLDNRDPEQIAQEAERLQSFVANRAEFRRQQYAYDSHIQLLKQQLYEKGRTLDSRAPVNNEDLTVEDILLKKRHLEAELASLEAGRGVDPTTKAFHQAAYQLDNRPRRFAVQIPDEKDYNDVADTIENSLQLLKARPKLSHRLEEPIENEHKVMKKHSVIVVDYRHHWQAQRMFDTLNSQLQGKAKIYWCENEMNALNEGMRYDQQPAFDQQIQGGNEGVHYNDLGAPQDLDVAEDDDWHY